MKTEITIEGAQATLRDLEKIRTRSRNSIIADFVSIPLMLWGLIWGFCHLNGYMYSVRGSGFFGIDPDSLGRVVVAGGFVVTALYIAVRLRFANPIRKEGSWWHRCRAPMLVVVWLLFQQVALRMLQFSTAIEENAFNSMYWMLLYIVYGLWLENGLLVVIGLAMSALALIGVHCFPEEYHLLVGQGGGGILFLGGAYALVRYRTPESQNEESVESGETA